MFLFDTLLYFSTTFLTLLSLVSHQEFHEFPDGTNFPANPTKWLNTLKHFVGKLPSLSVFDHFVWLALKGLRVSQ